jgi:DNA-binding response OmpR family regulator
MIKLKLTDSFVCIEGAKPMKKESILVVDDDISMLKLLKDNLEARNYRVFIAQNGPDAIHITELYEPDLIILELMLPGMDGREVCKTIRNNYRIPIIILSALDRTIDKIECLDIGADDYVIKPFAMEELLSRIRAVLRRTASKPLEPGDIYINGDLKMDFNQKTIFVGNKEITTTATEFRLLELLVKNADKVLPYRFILNNIWGNEFTDEKEYVREYIMHLRKKLGKQTKVANQIITVRGFGYKYDSNLLKTQNSVFQ